MEREPTQSRAKTTKDSILIAAKEILSKSGPIKTSISEVSHRAGVSVGSVYQYFKNLDSLYLDILHRENSREMKLGTQLVDDLEEGLDQIKLEEIVDRMVNFSFSSLKRVYYLGQGVAAVMPGAHARFRKKIRDEGQAGIAERLRKNAAYFKLENPDYTAFVLIHGACGVIEAYLVRRENVDEALLKKEVKKMFLAYLVQAKT